MPTSPNASPSPTDLHAFVRCQDAATLADRLWQWAQEKPDLMLDVRAWYVRAQERGGAGATRALIADLMYEPSAYLDEADTWAYAERAGKVLDLLAPWLGQDPVQLRELCEFALECLYEVTEIADDSSGELGTLQEGLIGWLMDALEAAPPPAAWLDRWRGLMEADPMGAWDEDAVLKVAGPAVQARYGELATQEWQDWLAQPRPATDTGYDGKREGLRRRYLRFVELQGDDQALYAAMSASASTRSDYLHLTQFCETLQWLDKAAHWAKLAYAQFPEDRHIEAHWLRCCERDGLHAEALRLRRKLLESRPTVEAYQAVLAAAQRAGCDVPAYREEVFAWAKAQETLPRPVFSRHAMAGLSPGQPDVSTRLAWLISEQRLDEALRLVQPPHGCDGQLLWKLATALPAPQHADAVLLLQRLFNASMPMAKSPYTYELTLVRETRMRMPEAQGREWLAYLRAQYKAKRNFIKELPAS